LIFKLWLWVFEFKLRRKKNDERIKFLVHSLLSEVEGQGYRLQSTPDVQSCSIGIHKSAYGIANYCYVGNVSSKWEVLCGSYDIKGGYTNEND